MSPHRRPIRPPYRAPYQFENVRTWGLTFSGPEPILRVSRLTPNRPRAEPTMRPYPAAAAAARSLDMFGELVRDEPRAVRSRAATLRDIAFRWETIRHFAEVSIDAPSGSLGFVPAPKSILGASTKIRKASDASGASIAVSYLAPADMLAKVAGGDPRHTLCALATVCKSPCLGGNDGRGQLSFPTGAARLAQLGRSALLLGDPVSFGSLLGADILRHVRRSGDASPFVRLDGTSDLGIGTLASRSIGDLGATPYDYTKILARSIDASHAVTFSSTPSTLPEARRALDAGSPVSVVVASARGEAPAAYAARVDAIRALGAPIVDGDGSEPLERRPEVRALSLKVGSRAARVRALASGLVFQE